MSKGDDPFCLLADVLFQVEGLLDHLNLGRRFPDLYHGLSQQGDPLTFPSLTHYLLLLRPDFGVGKYFLPLHSVCWVLCQHARHQRLELGGALWEIGELKLGCGEMLVVLAHLVEGHVLLEEGESPIVGKAIEDSSEGEDINF